MPITTSAKKALRASKRKYVMNQRRTKALRDATKNVKKSLTAGNTAEAEKHLRAAYKAIDKAAKRGVIKKNAASRRKSRLAQAIRRKKA